jgi:RimJ/RimL family protein N-acetyltransferase
MSARRKRRREQARRHQISARQSTSVRRVELHEASRVERLTYSRKQAAEALGVSVATIDRRVVPAIDTVKTPWGQRLIPVDELERFLRKHIESGHPRAPHRPAGRPPSLPRSVVDRVQLEYARGRSLGEIAEGLTADSVPTAHGGRRWWPSTARAVLLRASAWAPGRSPALGALHSARCVIALSLPLQTDRLLLRSFREDDYDALYAIQSRDDVGRYLPWGARDEDAVRAAIELRLSATSLDADGDRLVVAVVLAATSELIGECVLILVSAAHQQGEIGVVFHPDHHGRGYATEAARRLLRLAFAELGLHRVIGRLDARNEASTRLMERLAMRREAHFVENQFNKGEWESELVYAILQREWSARSAARDTSSE